MKVQYSGHALEVIAARGLKRRWILRALKSPECKERQRDGTVHYLARVSERGKRVLRVIVNPGKRPPCVVTAFFDRRMKGKLS